MLADVRSAAVLGIDAALHRRVMSVRLDSAAAWLRDQPSRAANFAVARNHLTYMYEPLTARQRSSLTGDKIAEHRAASDKGKGLYTRLNSHAGGRRSGDQFCVYVADRLVLPGLASDQIAGIAGGSLSFDALVRVFIHTHLGYRFAEAPDGATARQWESALRRGALAAGPPLLNPDRSR